MKNAVLAALLVVLVPLNAAALNTDELLGLVAMPLAVAAASEVTGVPVGELSHFVSTLNRAQVPPTQFVQVVRYAPAALVIEQQQPTFVQYVDQQVDSGIVGPRLVTVIEDRYRSYDLEPQFLILDEPATTYVVREDYIPPTVVTRVAQYAPAYPATYSPVGSNDLLGLIAMPLAVAAVSDMTGVPFRDLSSLVATLNAARMPPLQVVEVLRYSPVFLVSDVESPRFVRYVETQVRNGIAGPALIDVIGTRLRTYDVEPRWDLRSADVIRVVDNDSFFPPVVRTRTAEVRSHPHGGPPGQLKKELGLQTGAEVVHGTRVVRDSRDRAIRTTDTDRDRPARVVRKAKPSRTEKTERRVTSPRTGTDRGSVKKAEKPRTKRSTVERSKPSKVERRVEKPRVERNRVEKVKPERGGGKAKSNGKNKGKGKG